MRRYYWYFTGYLKKHGWRMLLSIVLGIGAFSLIIPLLFNPAIIKPKQYIGIIGDYTLTTLPEEIQHELSIGLTTIGTDGSPQPGLSERWTLEQENQMYRFFLNKGARWQDGSDIQPEDIQYNFPDVQIITTPNDVIFKLPDAYSPFPTLVNQPIFKSGSIKGILGQERQSLIGIGANWIADYKLNGTRLRELSVENKTSVKVYRFYLTEDEAVLAFKRGEVDLVPDLNRTFDVMEWPTTEVTAETDYWNYVAVYFNLRKPELTEHVRQALSYGLTKRTDETRAIGPISPDSWAFLPGGKTYDRDLNRGADLLLSELPGTPLNFSLTTTSVHLSMAEEIKKEWEDFGRYAVEKCQSTKKGEEANFCPNLGITITIRVQNFPDLSSFDLLLIGTPIDPDPDQYVLWHSDQPTNFTGYKNTRIDNLLERGRQVSDQAERKQIYQEFQQFLQEDPPAVFLEYLTKYQIKRKNPFESMVTVFMRTIGRPHTDQPEPTVAP